VEDKFVGINGRLEEEKRLLEKLSLEE
jgi:hypothetical protein